MAYELGCNKDATREIWTAPNAAKTPGQAETVASKVGFWIAGAVADTLAVFIFKAKRVFADAEGATTYAAGDAVYDSGASPTGIVNKTSGAGRTIVGYALKSYPAGTTRIEIEDFDGTRAVA
ncbi:hypothetical protein [Leptospira bandrabouensis]|uniref:hypothetical protein n=1 Tax=Leptospira bandrabouensis TaxID=2484903 RepID=UPI0010915BDD|nr:hypothetical protein [Leptospira bandrabouensis]TGN08630.1 hypothetical protein EHR07_03685 [Leptospira bandrabouensis]